MEAGRDRYIRQWLSRVLRQDDPCIFEPTGGKNHSHAFQEPKRIRQSDSHRKRNVHQLRDKDTVPHLREEGINEEHRDKRQCDSHRKRNVHQLRDKDTVPHLREEGINEEHRDKRQCSEGPERRRSSPSNRPRSLSRLFTLDTPFRDLARSHHLEQPRTTIAELYPAAISSTVPHAQKPRSGKSREHTNITPTRGRVSHEPGLVTASAGPNTGKEYGRRPRRKTRPDRYEPKDEGGLPRKTKGDKVKKTNPKKGRRRLSKAEIGEEFKAPNIKQNRLTLASKPGLGIFRNGKASSPKRLRDLPDLSFSEMGFLARQKDRENRNQCGKSVTKEISHYFSQPLPINKADSVENYGERVRRSWITNSSCSALDAPRTSRRTPVRRLRTNTSSAMGHHTRSRSSLPILRTRESDARELERDDAKLPPENLQPIEHSTTYYTRSESDHHTPKPRDNRSQLVAAQVGTGNRSLRRSLKGSSHVATNPSQCKAEAAVFQNASLTDVSNANSASRGYLTLGDLRNLAEINSRQYCASEFLQENNGHAVVKSNLENGEHKANSLVNASRQSQSRERENNQASTESRNACNLPAEPLGYLGAGPKFFSKDTMAIDPTVRGYKYHLLKGLERNERWTEKNRAQTSQTDEVGINKEDSTPASNKYVEPSNMFRQIFLDARRESCVASISAKYTANEHSQAFNMLEGCQLGQELDETTLHDSHLDLSGLDSFDRNVLEKAKLNATFPEDDLCGYEHRLPSLLQPTNAEPEEVMLSPMANGAFCMQGSAPVYLAQGRELDHGPPMDFENRHYSISTPRGDEYSEAPRPPSVVFGCSAKDEIYGHDYLGGKSESTPVNGNSEQGIWVSRTRSRANVNKSLSALREGSLGGLPPILGRERNRSGLGKIEQGTDIPIGFWRPNRLY